MSGDEFVLSPEMLAKAAVYAGVLALVGACGVRWFLVPRLAAAGESADAAGLTRSAATVLLAASAVTLAALFVRAWTHTIAAFGVADALVWDNVRLIAIESRWGQGWSWQALAGGAMLLLSLAVRAGWAGAWPLASVAAAGLCATLPLVGHAAGDGARMAVHTVHLLGGGLWLGSLAVLFTDLARRGRGSRPFELFSPLALTGAAVVALSGLLAASLYVGPPGHLVTTAYGRTLSVKIALVAGVGTAGYVNWRRLQRAHGVGAGPATHATLGRTVRIELACAAAVILITGVLTELAHP